jgi:hypothetical protein
MDAPVAEDPYGVHAPPPLVLGQFCTADSIAAARIVTRSVAWPGTADKEAYRTEQLVPAPLHDMSWRRGSPKRPLITIAVIADFQVDTASPILVTRSSPRVGSSASQSALITSILCGLLGAAACPPCARSVGAGIAG